MCVCVCVCVTDAETERMEKTLMPGTQVAAPDAVEARFTNREENSTRVELQSKFVSKEVYKLSENLYQDSTVEKPYLPPLDLERFLSLSLDIFSL